MIITFKKLINIFKNRNNRNNRDKIHFRNLEILDIDDEVLSLQIRIYKVSEFKALMKDLSKGKSMEEIQENEEDMKLYIAGLIKALIYIDGTLLFENDEDVLEMDAIILSQITNGIMSCYNIT